MKNYINLDIEIESYILSLKKLAHSKTVNLPEFWPQEDMREIHVLDTIANDLREILNKTEV